MNSAEKRRLLEVHYLDFFSLAMAMLRNVDDAKDAVQETMVQVLTKRHVDNVMSYTYATLRNQAINIIRRRRKVISFDENAIDLPEEHESRLELVGRLHEELPESLRALVELHDIEDYSVNELAALTGLSSATIHRRLDDAHELLKKRIEEEI